MIQRNETQINETKITYQSNEDAAGPGEALAWLAAIISSEEITKTLAAGERIQFNFDLQTITGKKVYFTVVGNMW